MFISCLPFLLAALGGAIGSVLRLSTTLALDYWTNGTSIPTSTAAINILGCFVAGCAFGFFGGDIHTVPPPIKAFLFVGILGGFTTFSAFSVENLQLLNQSQWSAGLLHLTLNVAGSLLAVVLGFRLMLR